MIASTIPCRRESNAVSNTIYATSSHVRRNLPIEMALAVARF
jgi:hypothetical protein